MTGAMYAAISGLKTHMNKLNVIGNNIANVNTYGYKAQRTVFSDSIYVTSRSGSDGTQVAGGVNPSQVGYGVDMTSIDLEMSTGTYAPTGKDSDCMIQGDGFFLVGDKEVANNILPEDPNTLKALTLTRVGNMDFKADGYLSDGQGQVIYGFLCTGIDAEGQPVFSDQLVPIRLPRVEEKTEQDADGNDIITSTVKYPVVKDGILSDAPRDAAAGGGDDTPLPFAQLDTISISKNGRIQGVTKDTGTPITIGFIALGNVTNPNGVTHIGGPYYKAMDGAGDLKVCLMDGAAKEMKIGTTEDGTGVITDPTIFTHINASKADGAGGDDLPDGMRIGDGGDTSLLTGGLESSKTDLANEFAEMITTQRGYQANTRIVTVTDQMLEELVNMKR